MNTNKTAKNTHSDKMPENNERDRTRSPFPLSSYWRYRSFANTAVRLTLSRMDVSSVTSRCPLHNNLALANACMNITDNFFI